LVDNVGAATGADNAVWRHHHLVRAYAEIATEAGAGLGIGNDPAAAQHEEVRRGYGDIAAVTLTATGYRRHRAIAKIQQTPDHQPCITHIGRRCLCRDGSVVQLQRIRCGDVERSPSA
jgi:hypothetical protein